MDKNNSKSSIPKVVKSDVEKEQLVMGEISIAEYVGLSKTQLYEFAKQGYQLVQMGRLEEAKTIFKGLVAADPYDSVFHCQLAGIYFKQKEYEKAFNEYNASLQFNLSNVDALAGRGELYLMQEKFEEGIEDLRKAIENDPQSKKASSVRARGLLLSLKDAVENQNKEKSKVTSS